jgi:diaminopimelate epimerase
MRIPFWKMHGAANDFILADDRGGTFPAGDRAWLAAIAARRTGVGCEGIILIQPSKQADFRMRFFNPDGREAEMCGNGARCVARLAQEIGAAPATMRLETMAGPMEAQVAGANVTLRMTVPHGWRLREPLTAAGRSLAASFVNTGVPHAVVELSAAELAELNVQELGAAIRYHAAYAPAGTNANFIAVTGPRSLRIRTYERGVEAETLACGTGVTAGALIAAKLGLVRTPVSVAVASGDTLTVDAWLTDAGAEAVTLQGPTAHVFQGVLDYGA